LHLIHINEVLTKTAMLLIFTEYALPKWVCQVN